MLKKMAGYKINSKTSISFYVQMANELRNTKSGKQHASQQPQTIKNIQCNSNQTSETLV